MTDRDRLIEILKVPIHPKIGVDPAEVVADYLLANGVFLLPEDLRGTEDFSISAFIEAMKMYKQKDRYIKLPCKVGDTYYTIEKYCNTDPYATEKEKVSTSDCEYWCNGEHCSFKEYRIEEHKWASIITILEKEQWFGKHYFLTKAEAEQKLKELKK